MFDWLSAAPAAMKCLRTAGRLSSDGKLIRTTLQRWCVYLAQLNAQVRNVVQHSSFDLPDAAVSRPQSASSSGRDQQGRDAILCSRLKGHHAATTCALVTSDAGMTAFLLLRGSACVLDSQENLKGVFFKCTTWGGAVTSLCGGFGLQRSSQESYIFFSTAHEQMCAPASKATHLSILWASMQSLQKLFSFSRKCSIAH